MWKITDTTGQPIWQPSMTAGQPDRLLGYPVYIDPNLPAMGTGLRSVYSGNWGKAVVIRDVGSLRFEISRDYAFAQDISTARAILRTDSRLLDNRAYAAFVGGAT